MIDGVCGRIVSEFPEARFLTIHDSALVVEGLEETVRGLIRDEFAKYGVGVTIKSEQLGGRES